MTPWRNQSTVHLGHAGKWTHCSMHRWWNQSGVHLWRWGKWTHTWMKPWGNNKLYTSHTRDSELTAERNPEWNQETATLTLGKVNSLLNETLNEINKLCNADTWESELTAEWNPDEINILCTSENRVSELTGKRNRDETINCAPLTVRRVNSPENETLMKQWTVHLSHSGKWTHSWIKPWWKNKLWTSHTRESELTNEWNPDEIKKLCTSAIRKVNSRLNEAQTKTPNCASLTLGNVKSPETETLMKSIKCAPVTLEKVNSLLNETVMEPVNCAPPTLGKVNSLLKETSSEINKLCTSDTGESELTAERNPDENDKLCTSDTRECELTSEWNCAPLTIGKVNSPEKDNCGNQQTVQLWHAGKWTHSWMKPWWKR